MSQMFFTPDMFNVVFEDNMTKATIRMFWLWYLNVSDGGF